MQKPITFVILFSMWLLWSGFYDPFHITLGAISSLIVVVWTGHLFVESSKSVNQRVREWLRYEWYTIWLLGEIVIANIQVFKLSFSPDILNRLNPKLVSFSTKIKGEVPMFILAQSITLTPGTVLVRITDNEFFVHALDDHSASGLPGDMEKKIAKIFKKGRA